MSILGIVGLSVLAIVVLIVGCYFFGIDFVELFLELLSAFLSD